MKKKSGDYIIIPRKAMYGIAPAVAIIAVLLSKGKAPEVLLFCIGIFVGFMIAKGYFAPGGVPRKTSNKVYTRGKK
jgi:hypothetical protein